VCGGKDQHVQREVEKIMRGERASKRSRYIIMLKAENWCERLHGTCRRNSCGRPKTFTCTHAHSVVVHQCSDPCAISLKRYHKSDEGQHFVTPTAGSEGGHGKCELWPVRCRQMKHQGHAVLHSSVLRNVEGNILAGGPCFGRGPDLYCMFSGPEASQIWR
jgi:hypothetical protein